MVLPDKFCQLGLLSVVVVFVSNYPALFPLCQLFLLNQCTTLSPANGSKQTNLQQYSEIVLAGSTIFKETMSLFEWKHQWN